MIPIEPYIYLALGLIVIVTRIWARWVQVGPSNWQFDDYLMPVTGIVLALKTIAVHNIAETHQGLTNSYMTDEERTNLDPGSVEYYNRQWGSKLQLIIWSLYAFILWATKVCVIVFYGRLTSRVVLMHLRLRVRIAYGLIGATYIYVVLSLLIACRPISRYWQINPDPGDLCYPANSKYRVFAVLIPNIVTDAYLLSIPLPLLWVANIGLQRKMTLTALFSGAIFVAIAGVLRGVFILKAGPKGGLIGSNWACRETFVAIVVTNLPIIHPLFRKAATKIGSSSLFSKASRSVDTPPRASEHSSGGIGVFQGASRHPLTSIPRSSGTSDQSALNHGALEGYRQSPGRSGSLLVSREFTVVKKGMAVNQEGKEKMWFTERVPV